MNNTVLHVAFGDARENDRGGHGTFTPLYLAGISTDKSLIELASTKINENINMLTLENKVEFRKLAGRSIYVQPDDVPVYIKLTFNNFGVVIDYAEKDNVTADVTVSGPLFAIINLLNDNNDSDGLLYFRHVYVSGDNELLRDLTVVLKS